MPEVLITYEFNISRDETKTKALTVNEETEYEILKTFYETIWLQRLQTLHRFYIEGKEYIIPQTYSEEVFYEEELYMILMEYVLISRLYMETEENLSYYYAEKERLKDKLERKKNINS